MDNADSFHRIKLLKSNPKNLRHSSSMNSLSNIRNSLSISRTDKNYIKKRKKKDKIISTSSLGLIKNTNNGQNNEVNSRLNNKIISIPDNNRYSNQNSIFLNYNRQIKINALKKKLEQKTKIFPDIFINHNKNVTLDHKGDSNKVLHRNNSQKTITREMTTFYSINKNHYPNFLLDKRIKIFTEKKPNTFNSKSKEANSIINMKEYGYSNSNKRFFNKLLPNDLKNFKKKLFDDSIKKNNNNNSKIRDYIPSIASEKALSNSKRNYNINKSNTLNNNIKVLESSKSIKLDEEKNYENIEFNGIVTKIITKLSPEKESKDNDKDNTDYHKIMKHPFGIESYGYDFLHNINNKYKIYENPFEDKDLIYNIHNLIINPNLKKFRNDNLILGADYYKKRNNSETIKDYKLLSKQGYEKMQSSIIRGLQKDVKDKIANLRKLKVDLDILMERNIRKFKEQREELINSEL